MAFDPPLIRGDARTFDLSNLLDGEGVATEFGADDVVRFTIKRRTGQADADALIAKSSDDGITLNIGTATGTIDIAATDWGTEPLSGNIAIYWDVQIAIDGDEDNTVTLAHGTDTLHADVTLTSP